MSIVNELSRLYFTSQFKTTQYPVFRTTDVKQMYYKIIFKVKNIERANSVLNKFQTKSVEIARG